MSKAYFIFLLFIAPILGSNRASAQGCSDAGFCTIGAMKAGGNTANRNNSIGLSYGINSGEEGTSILIPQLELSGSIGKKGYIEANIPFVIASGDLGSNASLGDLILTYTRQLRSKEPIVINGTIGTRISTGNADATDKGIALPMPYQSNLGTTDLILGLSVKWEKYISAAIGYQQPIIQYNENGYLPTNLSGNATGDYFPSRQLDRKGDILLRIQGHLTLKKFGIAAGPLFIYHLGEDIITLTNGSELSLTGSNGLTLNITANAYYQTNRWRADVSVGTPTIVRDSRPDGLTRSFTLVPRITYIFKK